MKENLELKLLSSLAKVLPNRDNIEEKYINKTIAKNEVFSFQVAYKYNDILNGTNKVKIEIRVNNNIAKNDEIKLYNVNLVHTDLATYPKAYNDPNYISVMPGVFPDILEESVNGEAILLTYWRAVWIDFKPLNGAGKYNIEVRFILNNDENDYLTVAKEIEVLDFELPKQTLYYTNWFHSDCLSSYYNADIFSEIHWNLIRNYVKTAADYGMNMILTPVFTPPLDIAIGGERPTVQLVNITIDDGKYIFKFDKLERWIKLCLELGIEYFEISHFFTQWGSKNAPKIVAKDKNGNEKKIFGWDTKSDSKEYVDFLNEFILNLLSFLQKLGVDKKCFFHVSDEPSLEHLEDYKKAKNIIKPLLKDYIIIDALSDIEFYKSGALENPIPANDHIDDFIKADVKNLWTYYCCVQCVNVSNRFFSMPSARNRILATQLFKYDIVGFLHWGYNFWYSQYSRRLIDPFYTTDADMGFPGGDSFVVYPGKNDEPIVSLRLKVFKQALDDLRAFQLLSSITSKDFVMKLIENDSVITFSKFPMEDDYILKLRDEVNKHILDKINN